MITCLYHVIFRSHVQTALFAILIPNLPRWNRTPIAHILHKTPPAWTNNFSYTMRRPKRERWRSRREGNTATCILLHLDKSVGCSPAKIKPQQNYLAAHFLFRKSRWKCSCAVFLLTDPTNNSISTLLHHRAAFHMSTVQLLSSLIKLTIHWWLESLTSKESGLMAMR